MIKVILVLFFSFYYSYADDMYHSLKAGILSHSTGLVSSGKESGIDLHAEVQFKEGFLRGHYTVGTDLNINNDTSFIFGGLAWEGRFFDNLLLGCFFGLAIHNGELDGAGDNKRNMGSRILFREALDIGFYLNKNTSLSLIYDHYSNLGLNGVENQGNDNFGFRFGYYF